MKSSQKTKDLLDKFKLAVSQLEEAINEPIKNNRDRAGIVQTFEFTYELSWKTLKSLLSDMGHEVVFARESYEKAFALGLIKNSHPWPEIVQDRNVTSHVYSSKAADAIINRIKNDYFESFRELQNVIAGYVKL